MQYNYRNIIRSVAVNLGINSPSSLDISIIKRDIYDVTIKAFRQAKPIKDILTETVTSDMNELYMPELFFSADEVIFKDSNDQRYYVKEITQEEYMRWSPDYTLNEVDFETVALEGEAETLFRTQENLEFDGNVCYYFADSENISILNWKPGVSGTLSIMYSIMPADDIVQSDSSPQIHKSFMDILILGATIKGLLRKDVKDDIQFANKTLKLRMYTDELKQVSAEYAGYINRSTSTPIIKPMDFMNFYEDIIYG